MAPHQWSFPLDLPVQAFGIFPVGVLTPGAAYPWGDELDFRTFSANLARGARAVLCEPIGEPIKQSAKLIGEPITGRAKTGTSHCTVRPLGGVGSL